MDILKELFSDIDGLSPSEVMGFIAGIAGIVLAFLSNSQAVTVLGFSAGCFGVNKFASATVKTSQAKAASLQQAAPKTGPPAPSNSGGGVS